MVYPDGDKTMDFKTRKEVIQRANFAITCLDSAEKPQVSYLTATQNTEGGQLFLDYQFKVQTKAACSTGGGFCNCNIFFHFFFISYPSIHIKKQKNKSHQSILLSFSFVFDSIIHYFSYWIFWNWSYCLQIRFEETKMGNYSKRSLLERFLFFYFFQKIFVLKTKKSNSFFCKFFLQTFSHSIPH